MSYLRSTAAIPRHLSGTAVGGLSPAGWAGSERRESSGVRLAQRVFASVELAQQRVGPVSGFHFCPSAGRVVLELCFCVHLPTSDRRHMIWRVQDDSSYLSETFNKTKTFGFLTVRACPISQKSDKSIICYSQTFCIFFVKVFEKCTKFPGAFSIFY